jgi:hypothetical protein
MMARSEMDAVVAKGSRGTACGREGKSSFINVDGSPEPRVELAVDGPLCCQLSNQLSGAGIVPAVIRDV